MVEHPDFPGGASIWWFVGVAVLLYIGIVAEKRQQKRDHERSLTKPRPPIADRDYREPWPF